MWVLNFWLYLCFFFAPQQYKELKALGTPCYANVNFGDGPAAGPPPICFYDPKADNPEVEE